MSEEWRPVVGWETTHEVSNLGRVRRLDGQILSSHQDRPGYVIVTIAQRPRKVHRLVAAAFIGPPPVGREIVDHLDGDPANPRLENLEYVSHAENLCRAFARSKIAS